MGKSGFRIMLYKLRDFARKSPNNQQAGNNKDIKIERTISLPRSSYYHKFAAATAAAAASSSSPSQGLARHELESPAVPNYGKDEKKIRKDKGKLVRGKSNNMPGRSSTLIDTRVSAGCSCRAKVGSKGEKVAKKKSSASKNHVLKKNLQVFEMEKQGNPKCSRSMEILKQRNKGIIQEIEKEYSDAPTAKVSFDGAVKEKIRLGFQSLQEDQALENNDNERDNARKCFGGALKHDEGSVFESPEAQPVLKSYNRNINNGKRCSAFCCSCRLSISDSIDEFDETPLDVDIWSEKEDCESEDLQLPFLTKSDRVVLDMKINFSTEEMRESNVGLFRRNDAAAHAQVQAKLGQMIQEKGSKKKKNNVAPANFTSNGKDFHISAKEASSGPETEHSLSPEAKNEVRVHQIDEVEGNYEGRAKIDRRRGNLRSSEPKIDQKCKGTVNLAQKKISESLAIVKCSYDPWRDFKESMVEMIQENDIRDSQDLKELLHCYICLNSHEYHDVIFQVFEQVRLDLRMPEI